RDLAAAMASDAGLAIDRLRVDGGMAVSDWTMQFLADILPAQIERPASIETTAWGAAYAAGLTRGLCPEPEAMIARWTPERRFTPAMPDGEREERHDGDRGASRPSGRLDRSGPANGLARRVLPRGARMTNQLPPPGAMFLDHVAHFVPEMDAAAAALERCGFRLTPFTAQTNRVDGQPVPAGTGNRCAMLRQGYVEILTAVATPGGNTELARQLLERIAEHGGLHLAACSSADAAAEHRRLAEAGFATLPLVDMRRPVTTHTGSEDARFTIARIAHHSMP